MFKLFFVLPFVGQSGRGWWGKHLGGAGVFIPYLYLFCISKSKIGVESGLTGVVCSDWRCKVTAVSGSFQQISCISPRVVMTPARFAWHPLEHLSYVSCQGKTSAKNMLNNGLMMAPFILPISFLSLGFCPFPPTKLLHSYNSLHPNSS